MKMRNFFLTAFTTITWICLLTYIVLPAQVNADNTGEAQAEIRSREITAKAAGHRPGLKCLDQAAFRYEAASETNRSGSGSLATGS